MTGKFARALTSCGFVEMLEVVSAEFIVHEILLSLEVKCLSASVASFFKSFLTPVCQVLARLALTSDI